MTTPSRRRLPLSPVTAALPVAPRRPGDPLLDLRGRPLHDLRISVTDRCNFRCTYCMPRATFGRTHRFLPKPEILTFEEIARVGEAAVALGVRKIRITGGEPLLRAELPRLVEQLAAIPGIDLALTTNGSLLAAQAAALRSAGLGRITVSLDSLDPARFRAMSDTDVPLSDVLAGIDAAIAAGFGVKVNTVVRRGVNEPDVVALARRFRGTGITVRFIEYMDVGVSNGWRRDQVVSAREIVERIDREMPLEPAFRGAPAEVAKRYRYRDGTGEIGVIASVTEPFCGDCTRARVSADGHLYTCLFAAQGVDLRPALREGGAVGDVIAATWAGRSDRYSELRGAAATQPRIEMSYIGG